VMHVPDTGHTPVLSDRNQYWFIHEWLLGRIATREWSGLLARLREGDLAKAAAPARLASTA
jgi:hypothetical protein